MKLLDHVKIIARGIGYMVLFAGAAVVVALIGGFVARYLFAAPCAPTTTGCKSGLIGSDTGFIIKQVIAAILFFIPIVAVAPFVLFSKVAGFFLNDPTVWYPPYLSGITYPASFHIAFFLTIVYYVSYGVLVSYYQAYKKNKPVLEWVLKGLIIFHGAVAFTTTILSVQLYPY